MSAPTPTTPLKTESQRDCNYVSLQRDTVTLFAGTDAEAHYANADVNLQRISLIPPEPKLWETALKCSDRHGTALTALRVAQCKENVLDINASSSDLNLTGDWGVVGDEGEQVITIKGGSHDIRVAGEVHSHGRRADIVIGLYSDQSFAPTHDIDLSSLQPSTARSISGRPLTVILCRVNQPWRAWFGGAPKDIQLPPGARVLKLASFGAQVHYWAKLGAVKAGLIKGRKE